MAHFLETRLTIHFVDVVFNRYHRVSSEPGEVSIAVNYWHDMQFLGPNFVYYRLVRSFAGLNS